MRAPGRLRMLRMCRESEQAMRQIHVLHVIDGLNVGGAEISLRDLVQGLLQGGRYRVSVCYSTPGPLVAEMAALGPPMVRLPRLARVDPLLLLRMCQAIRRDPPHIVHTHLFKSDFHGRVAARLCGVPVVVSTLQNCDGWADNPLLGRIYGFTARFADRLIAVSNEVRDFAMTHTRVAPDKLRVIPNSVALQRFVDQEEAGRALRREFGIAEGAPLLGIIARLAPQKDHLTLLEAAVRIRSALPEARFLIVGDGPLRKTLVTRACELGLDQAVIFCGLRNDIPAAMAALDLLVLSSRWEGLPVALVEGMAAARPVVATAVGGVPDVVLHGSTGLLVPPGDPAALAHACIQVLTDPDLRARLGHAGRARAEAHFSLDAMVRQTSQLYEELLSRRGLSHAIPVSSAS